MSISGESSRSGDKLAQVFCTVLGAKNISDETAMWDLEDWDSMAHVGLVLELERTFAVSIPPGDAIDLTSVAVIRSYLKQRGATGV